MEDYTFDVLAPSPSPSSSLPVSQVAAVSEEDRLSLMGKLQEVSILKHFPWSRRLITTGIAPSRKDVLPPVLHKHLRPAISLCHKEGLKGQMKA